jgi:hypothetical protein
MYIPSVRERKPVLLSKEASLKSLTRINPPNHHWQSEDKAAFYQICAKEGLPIPRYIGHAIDGRMYDAVGSLFHRPNVWIDYLQHSLPQHFVTKEQTGVYGRGFKVYRRVDQGIEDIESRTVLTLSEQVDEWSRYYGRRGFVLQERLFDAAPLCELSGQHSLQSMRVATELNDDCQVSVLFYWLKVLGGSSLSDNFSFGLYGNLAAYGDPASGILEGAVGLEANGTGLRVYHEHPVTGVRIKGLRIPHWQEAIATCQQAQACFPDLPTLGWDVALTDDGPKLLEANALWGPPIYIPQVMRADDWRRLFGSSSS